MPRSVKNTLAGYTTHNIVQLIRGGTPYFSCLKDMIDRAESSIHLQVYIFDDDTTGRLIANALIEAAKRSVKIYIMVDGFASQVLPRPFIEKLRHAGIHFRVFEPLFKSSGFYFGRRMHYKVFVADAHYCLVGGINIADRYNDLPGDPAWLDFALMAEGEVAEKLYHICVQMWTKSNRGMMKLLRANIIAKHFTKDKCEVRVRKNDWVQRQNQVSRSYLELFRSANEQIIIMSSYFLPGRSFRRNLSTAAKRGVTVKLVLAGASDIMLAKHAERYIYRWIFKNNMQIYEYSGTVLHAKIATCDCEMVTVGSYNVNNISAFASVEINLDVKNASFTKKVNNRLEEIIANNCVLITEQGYYIKFNIIQKLWQYICYQFVRMTIFLFTFYFKQKEK